ncbi:hypothetical protein J6590_104605 [Homalodisca vitripennis]|nr:hypothetical protein J6590_104605 [Homalodisca vitripennis]
MTTEINDFMDEESVRRALMIDTNEKKEEENIVSKLSPKVLEKDVTTESHLPDSEGDSTYGSVTKDNFGEVNRDGGRTPNKPITLAHWRQDDIRRGEDTVDVVISKGILHTQPPVTSLRETLISLIEGIPQPSRSGGFSR